MIRERDCIYSLSLIFNELIQKMYWLFHWFGFGNWQILRMIKIQL